MNCMSFIYVTSVLVLGLSGVECEIRGRIHGGGNVRSGFFKYMALILPKQPICCGIFTKELICGGTIIAPHWVLTAAHCIDGMSYVEVYLGAITIEDLQVGYMVRKDQFVVHPHWDDVNKIHDIGLIRIPNTVECDHIAYAALPYRWIEPPVNTIADMGAIAVGWGQIGDNGDMPKCLQWTETQIINTYKCKEILAFTTDNDICANTTKPYGSICKGDSGGPLLLGDTEEIIGITSFFPHETCEAGDPAVFVRLTRYLKWIDSVTGTSHV